MTSKHFYQHFECSTKHYQKKSQLQCVIYTQGTQTQPEFIQLSTQISTLSPSLL